jgi:hypothetical protein
VLFNEELGTLGVWKLGDIEKHRGLFPTNRVDKGDKARIVSDVLISRQIETTHSHPFPTL